MNVVWKVGSSLSQSQKSVLWIAGILLVLVGAVLALVMILRDGPGVAGMIAPQSRVVLQDDATPNDAAEDLPIEQFLPNEVLNLDAEDAMARNLALPVNRGPNPVAPSFVAQWLGTELGEATKCLASAVYYEAAGEPMAGQRAVAQVVLNRLRNPRYPKTICGVVYQGAERPTGCQFSFACDGSTRRVPSANGWAVATAVATSALNGVTSAEAGQATHYHTLAVFPAWAPQLAKIGILGHHVFYRPPGPATYTYDNIHKAPADSAMPGALPVIDPESGAVAPFPAVPADTMPSAASDAARSASPSSLALSQGETASTGRPANAVADRPAGPATPTAEQPRSMFPTRRTRTPNLPLASDR